MSEQLKHLREVLGDRLLENISFSPVQYCPRWWVCFRAWSLLNHF